MPNRRRFSRLALLFALFASLFAGTFSSRPQRVEAKPRLLQATNVVISEFRFIGSGGASDEFIELYNPTNSAINISGWWIRRSSGGGSTFDTVQIPTNLTTTNFLPGQYYLIVNSVGYNDTVTADLTYSTTGFANDGGVALTLADKTTIIDQAGLNSGSAYKEGTVLSPLTTSVDRGYERKLGGSADSCLDDGDNSTDFQLIAASSPQNSNTPTRLCGGNADLRITQTVDDATPIVSGQVVFTITVFNDGTGDARTVQVKSLLPSGLSYVTHSALTGTYNSSTGIWDVGTLANGASATLSITADVVTGSVKTNMAEVWSSYDLDPDSTPANASTTSEDDDASVTVTPQTLIITNTVNNTNPLVGSNIIFTIQVTNPATFLHDAANVNVTAALPIGFLDYVSHSVTTGSYDDLSGLWTIGSLPIGSSAMLTLTAKVVNNTPPIFTALVTSDNYASNSAGVSFGVLSGQADLKLSQTLDLNTGQAGHVFITLTLENNGPDTATGVEVRDLLPSGLSYISTEAIEAGTYNSSTGIWAVGSLNNGATVQLKIKVKVAASGSSTKNTIQIWDTDQYDPNSINNVDELEVLIADLNLTQTVDVTASTAIFTITVTNSGPDDAANVRVKSNLPDVASYYQFVSSSQPSTFNSTTGIWDIGTLADGASATLVITTNTSGTLKSHIAEIYSSDVTDPDSLPNNKISTEDDIAGYSSADLSLTQTVDKTNPNLNENVVFTIRASNAGPLPATGVEVKSLLPSGLTFISPYTSTAGTYDPITGIWTIGTINSAATVELKITAKVSSNGSFVNLAEVYESDLFDPDSTPGNGQTTEDDSLSVSVTTPSALRPVIINEIAWAGTTSSLSGDEWIELYNTTNASINLTGWTLTAADGTPTISLSGTIPAGGYFLLEKDDNNTVSDVSADQIYTGDLSNSGETLTLRDGANTVIDTANGNGGSWPAGSSSTYGSMERTSTSADSDSIWKTNTGIKKNGKNANGGDILGTPKQSNSQGVVSTATPTKTPTPSPTPAVVGTLIPPRPILNEILARPGFDWNGDGEINVFDEFVEIKNLTAVDISLKGWKLDTFGNTSFSLPDVTLKPGQRIVYYSKETNLLLSDGGATVRLIDPNGKIYDAFTYELARTEDRSFCRLPDGNPGDKAWFEDCIPTPLLNNTREGRSPTTPNTESPFCNLPDTIPLEFFIAECNGYGGDIWNPIYWDELTGLFKRWLQSENKQDTFIE